jgi:hypothetical protein
VHFDKKFKIVLRNRLEEFLFKFFIFKLFFIFHFGKFRNGNREIADSFINININVFDFLKIDDVSFVNEVDSFKRTLLSSSDIEFKDELFKNPLTAEASSIYGIF